MSVSRRHLFTGAPAAVAVATSIGTLAASARASDDDLVVDQRVTLTADTVVTGDLIVRGAGEVELAPGVTLVVRGDVSAPARQIFWGRGRVDLTRARLLAARPEWWGAVAGRPDIDCEPALSACLRAHLVMLLGAGDYYLQSTLLLDQHNRQITGIGRTKDAGSTRLVLMRASGAVLQVGSSQPPPTINDYLQGVVVERLELGRVKPPTAASVAAEEIPTGLRIRHVLDAKFDSIRANEHAVGYSILGAVRTYLIDCRAFLTRLQPPKAMPAFVGFEMDGTAPPISTGANASLYLLDCNAGTGGAGAVTNSTGLRLSGAMSDTFLTRFETVQVETAVRLEGGAGNASRRPSTQVDVLLDALVLDQCQIGIDIADMGSTSIVEIRSPYVGLAREGIAAIRIRAAAGCLRISGGQLLGTSSIDATGIEMADSGGVCVDGTVIAGCARPIRARNLTDFEMAPAIRSPAPRTGAAIALESCRNGSVRPRLFDSGGYATGVAITGATRAVSIERQGLFALLDADRQITINGKPAKPVGTVTVVSRDS